MNSQASSTLKSNDEQAISELVDKWLAASKSGDLETVLSLMDDDVIFMVPGREPFGKEEFKVSNKNMKNVLKDSISDIQEIKILGNWAWIRNRLSVVLAPPNGETVRHSGYTLTIFRRNSNGAWVLFRDANLLTAET